MTAHLAQLVCFYAQQCSPADLHGLYTQEAIVKAEQVIQQAKAQNYPRLRVIVGKGIHSKDHVTHIGPAVERLVRQYNLAAHLDPKNTGVLIIDLHGPAGGGSLDFTRDMMRSGAGGSQDVSAHTHSDRSNASALSCDPLRRTQSLLLRLGATEYARKH